MKKKTDWKKKLTKSQQVALGVVKKANGKKKDGDLVGTYDDSDYGDVRVTTATLNALNNMGLAYGWELRLSVAGKRAATAVGY